MAMIRPKRLFVLCKGEVFYKVNSKDKKPTKRKFFINSTVCNQNMKILLIILKLSKIEPKMIQRFNRISVELQ